MTQYEIEYQLEKLIDASDIEDVLEALSDIASAKAYHVRQYQGGREIANRWELMKLEIDRVRAIWY